MVNFEDEIPPPIHFTRPAGWNHSGCIFLYDEGGAEELMAGEQSGAAVDGGGVLGTLEVQGGLAHAGGRRI